jgi:magnesium chelatase family protein
MHQKLYFLQNLQISYPKKMDRLSFDQFLNQCNYPSLVVKTYGSAVYGVEAITIAVEVNINNQGKSDAIIVGLPDGAVNKSLLRVESAIKNNIYFMPRTRLILNLTPADIRKSGIAFDLPIAMGTLRASEQLIHPEKLTDDVIMGN